MNDPFIFTEEVSRYSYVWITFIGMSLATKTSDHIRVDFFVGLLGRFFMPGNNRMGCLLTIVLGIAGAVFAGWFGREMGWYAAGQPAGGSAGPGTGGHHVPGALGLYHLPFL